MSSRVEVVEVWMWGRRVGAAAWLPDRSAASFEFDRDFQRSGIQLAPLQMPLGSRVFSFPALARQTFHGLPGLLADSLPDKFGSALIDTWLARQGRSPQDFSTIERLSYIGTRGMGALEFRPALREEEESVELEIQELVSLAGAVQEGREAMAAQLGATDEERAAALTDILRVGTSAGGARAKAVVAWNRETGELRSGQVASPQGFEPWLLKFDGVVNRDKELTDPGGYGRIEFAYSKLAKSAGLAMEDCHLLEENGRAHFMTRRFDRRAKGQKLHMQSLCAIAHYDFNLAGAYSYEQAMQVAQRIGLGKQALAEQFRRVCFNVIFRNQDDHTKNIAFLMNKRGEWSLAPAFDVNFAFNPDGAWTGAHQMSIAGKRDDFEGEDLLGLAQSFGIPKAKGILDEVRESMGEWRGHAEAAGVTEERALDIEGCFRSL